VRGNPDFRFTAKLWQRFTHGEAGVRGRGSGVRVDDAWTSDEVRAVTEGFAVLRDEGRLGAVLAQFPWSFRATEENRDHLRRLAEDFALWPVVIELRHGSWARREHARLLKELGLGYCNIDQPVIGDAVGPSAGATGAIGYVRFHGRNYAHWIAHEETAQRYDYLYTADELRPWVERVRKVAGADGVVDVYVITNNHYEGKGPANALMLRAMLEGVRAKAPPVLYATYTDALAPWAEPAAPSEPAQDRLPLP
jgi:uncharacterized protein YecE (DUF72 family)